MDRRTFMLAVPLILTSRPLWAHHGWSSFDETRPIYLAGKAARVRWQNPHAELVLELANPLTLPADLKSRTAPKQGAAVDAASIFAVETFCRTFPANFNEPPSKAFAGRWQKAKLEVISVGGAGASRDFFARTSHAQSPFQLFILSASFCHRRSIGPGRGHYYSTSILR